MNQPMNTGEEPNRKEMYEIKFPKPQPQYKISWVVTDELKQKFASIEKQLAKPYSGLSDEEIASNTDNVDRYWHLIEQYIDQAIKAKIEEIKSKLPAIKTLETDLPLDALEDEERFCLECGQYEFEGELNCRCCGFNECRSQVLQVLEEVQG